MNGWTKEDYIRFVEWRVRAFEVSRANEEKGIPPESPDHPLSELDLRIWLAQVRDGRSLSQIARKEYPRAWKTNTGKRGNQRAISRVRNSVTRVEKFLNRGGLGFCYPKKWQQELEASLKHLLLR